MAGEARLSDVLVRLATLLDGWNAGYAVIGGVAIIARARARLTRDIDLVVTIPDGRIEDFLAAARAHGFDDDPAETKQLVQAGLLRLWSSHARESAISIDVIVVDSDFLAGVVSRASPVDFGAAKLAVASAEDLVLLKLDAHRPHDIDDVLALKEACALDLEYLRREGERLGLSPRIDLYFAE